MGSATETSSNSRRDGGRCRLKHWRTGRSARICFRVTVVPRGPAIPKGKVALSPGTLLRRSNEAPLDLKDLLQYVEDPSALKLGTVCCTDLKRLRPTQATVGFIQVQSEAEDMSTYGKGKLRKTVLKKPIPVVVSPDKKLWVIDHHHQACALWTLGFDLMVVEVKAKYLKATPAAFWSAMRRNKWLHLYDEHGKALSDYTRLPEHMRDLGDNIYQSVAWAVKNNFGYTKSSVAVSDFQWPDFFRSKLGKEPNLTFRELVKRSMKLAQSTAAEGLPGYLLQPKKA
jgi:hypothetical protein